MNNSIEKRQAIERLQKVGLTEYESKCFVALSQISTGTAAEISDVSDIPRTRVYDLAESLQEQGLVELQDGTPREFRAVSTEMAVQKLERAHRDHLNTAAEALRSLKTPATGDSTSGIWSIVGQENVIERGQYIATQAETELFGFFTEKAVFREDCFRQAQHAIDRGVDVVLGASDDALRADLRDEFPEATIVSPTLDWHTLQTLGTQMSRVVMADRKMVMLASIKAVGSDYEETAVWGAGVESELVILCRQLIGSHINDLDGSDDTTETPL